jgi:methyl-accepting chemotaxis protein
MSWFHDLKMMKKLMVGFGLVALALPLLGYLGLKNMKQINQETSDLYNLHMLGLSYILDMQNQTRAIGRAVTAAINASEKPEIEKQAQTVAKTEANLQKTMAQIKTTLVRDDGKAKFAEAEKAFGEVMQVYNEALQLALSEQDKEAQAVSGKTRSLRDRSDRLMDELVKTKLKVAEASAKNAEQVYQSSRNFMVLVIAAAVLMAVGLGYFIAAVITKSLKVAVDTMDLAARGDLTARMDVGSKDEIGAMGSALNSFLISLEKSIGSIGHNANGLATSAEELSAVSQQMAGNAEETSSQANVVSGAAD